MVSRGEEDDPVVARVRQAREALAKECDYDLHRMAELLKAAQAEHMDRVRTPVRRSPGSSATPR